MSEPRLDGLLGPLERDVIEALWALAPCDVATVLDRCNEVRPGEALAYTTVMTVLARLFDKELVDRERVGRGYRYTPRFAREELIDHLGEREVRHVLARYGDVALSHFATALHEADPELLRGLRRLEDDGA